MNTPNRFYYVKSVEDLPCSTGLHQRVASVLAYMFGLAFVLIETQNRFVRFCAVQSLFIWAAWMVLFIGLSILSSIPLFGAIFLLARALVSLAFLVLLAGLSYFAHNGKKVIIAYISKYAEEWSAPDE